MVPVWRPAGVAARNPADLRARAVAAVDAGVARPAGARADRVHHRTPERWLARARRGLDSVTAADARACSRAAGYPA